MKKIVFIFTVVSILALISACGAKPTSAPPPPSEVQEIATQIPVITETPPLPTNTPIVTVPPTEVPTPTPVEIVHVAVPGNAVIDNLQDIRDCNTGERIAIGATTLVGSGCDNWATSKIERPVKAYNDSFISALDINRAYFGHDNYWYYATIRLHHTASGSIPPELTVSLELDTNLNSRGDYLVIASGFGSEWSTDGVQVWQDTTNDVGGEKPFRPGEPLGDGYDTLIFNAGVGDDADLVWKRISPSDSAVLEIAFKKDLMPANQVFAWWLWTSLKPLNDDNKEVVDVMVDAESWSMDNTCGWIFGASPSSQLLNLCETPPPAAKTTPTPEAPPAESCQPPPGGCNFLWYWDPDECRCRIWIILTPLPTIPPIG